MTLGPKELNKGAQNGRFSLALIDQEQVSKGEFATICNVTPGRVSQWLAQGHLTGDAIVGDGRNARIRVKVAQSQLRTRRDVGQTLSNGLGTNVRPPPPAQGDMLRPKDALKGDQLDDAIREAKLYELQARNRETAEKEAARRGLYLDANATRREMTQIAEQMLRVFEGALSDFATAMQSRFGLEHREVLHLLREQFRKSRTKAAVTETEAAAEVDALIEVEA